MLLSIIFLWSYNSFIWYTHTHANTNSFFIFQIQLLPAYLRATLSFICLFLYSSSLIILSFSQSYRCPTRILSKVSNSDKESIRAFNSAPPHHRNAVSEQSFITIITHYFYLFILCLINHLFSTIINKLSIISHPSGINELNSSLFASVWYS